jgi:hypothetical protein
LIEGSTITGVSRAGCRFQQSPDLLQVRIIDNGGQFCAQIINRELSEFPIFIGFFQMKFGAGVFPVNRQGVGKPSFENISAGQMVLSDGI